MPRVTGSRSIPTITRSRPGWRGSFVISTILANSTASTAIIVETRGHREDAELELAFRRVCDGSNALRKPFHFQLVMIPKSSNSTGLQLTDLMARPVALHHLRPGQPNRAFDL